MSAVVTALGALASKCSTTPDDVAATPLVSGNKGLALPLKRGVCETKSLREMEVQRRRGTTSPDPEEIPEPLRGPLGTPKSL